MSAGDTRAIFITGAASGMGRETARLFHENGWFIGAYDVNEDGLKTLEQELGPERCLVRRLDVADKPDYDLACSTRRQTTRATSPRVSGCARTPPAKVLSA